MPRDFADVLTLDPRIEQSGMTVTNLSFVANDDDPSEESRFDLTIAMRVENGEWPARKFQLQGYSDDGLMVYEDRFLRLTSTLDPCVQHLKSESYETLPPNAARFELLFEPETRPGPSAESWQPLPVQQRETDERLLGVTMTGLSAEFRPHPLFDDSWEVRVAGQVEGSTEIPAALAVQITVLDVGGNVRDGHQGEFDRGPSDGRVFIVTLTPHNQHTPARVDVRLYTA